MKFTGWVLLGCLALLAGDAWATRSTEPPPVKPRPVYALLIGYPDGPADGSLPRLSKTGTDVLMMAAFFGTLDPKALYVHIDDNSIWRELAPDARVHLGQPSWRAVQGSVEKIVESLQADEPADVYVYYAGHGRMVRVGERMQTELFLQPESTEADEGFDGVLRSKLLQDEVLKPLADEGGTRVHLVVDACQSYFVLEARGTEQVQRTRKAPPDVETAMAERFVDVFHGVGALLATNGSLLTYEDPAIGGLFSYAVRSAGIGAADLDGDGRVTYGELERALPFILGTRAGGGPPGLLAPGGQRDTPFVDYRGRTAAAVTFAPSQATRYELTYAPSNQHYAVLYPAADSPVVAFLPAGQRFVTTERRSPESPGEWFHFVAASAGFEALRHASAPAVPETGARGAGLERGIMAEPMSRTKPWLVTVEPPNWGWKPQTYVAVGAGGVFGTSPVGKFMANSDNSSRGVELSGVFGAGRHQGTARVGWSRLAFDTFFDDGTAKPTTVDALKVGAGYGYVFAEDAFVELAAGPYAGAAVVQLERGTTQGVSARGLGWLVEAGGELTMRLFVDRGRLALRTDLRLGAQRVSSSDDAGLSTGSDFTVGGMIGLEYEFVAQ